MEVDDVVLVVLAVLVLGGGIAGTFYSLHMFREAIIDLRVAERIGALESTRIVGKGHIKEERDRLFVQAAFTMVGAASTFASLTGGDIPDLIKAVTRFGLFFAIVLTYRTSQRNSSTRKQALVALSDELQVPVAVGTAPVEADLPGEG